MDIQNQVTCYQKYLEKKRYLDSTNAISQSFVYIDWHDDGSNNKELVFVLTHAILEGLANVLIGDVQDVYGSIVRFPVLTIFSDSWARCDNVHKKARLEQTLKRFCLHSVFYDQKISGQFSK